MNRRDFTKKSPLAFLLAIFAPHEIVKRPLRPVKETVINGPVTIKGEVKVLRDDGSVALHVKSEPFKEMPLIASHSIKLEDTHSVQENIEMVDFVKQEQHPVNDFKMNELMKKMYALNEAFAKKHVI